jgi:hypothetical protein
VSLLSIKKKRKAYARSIGNQIELNMFHFEKDSFTVEQLAITMVHEFCHIAGYDHATGFGWWNYTSRSVPYKIGKIVKDIAQSSKPPSSWLGE